MEKSKRDSRPATYEHIEAVRGLILKCVHSLIDRAHEHDKTKLENPELEYFDEYTWRLATAEYGSDRYTSFLKGLKPALDRHYATYRHHPEHHENGIHDMNLIDLLEMVCDWQAATKRSANGDIRKSIELNQKRFGYDDGIKKALLNTVEVLECE